MQPVGRKGKRDGRTANRIRALMNLRLDSEDTVPTVLILSGKFRSSTESRVSRSQVFWYMPRPVRLIRPSFDQRATICRR